MNITVIMWRYPKLQIISSDRIALWRKPIHWLKSKRYNTRLFCSLQGIWMLLQVWLFQVEVVVLTLAAGEETKMKMNLNGHVAAQKWQTVCANAGKDFIDKRTINNKSHGNWKIKNHSINKR